MIDKLPPSPYAFFDVLKREAPACTTLPIDVVQIADFIGLRCVAKDQTYPGLGGVDRHDERPHLLFRHDSTRDEQRLSLAHAIGHVVNHPGRSFVCHQCAEGECRVAHMFALELLMPTRYVQELTWAELDENALAKRFDVHPNVMRFKMRQLCILP